jgi:hypothetical protein
MITPPPAVTREVFQSWRDARRGRVEAEDLTNPYWRWLIESQVSSYAANQHFEGPSSIGGKPAWSWDRFGQSSTSLPDGRTVLVAGEHEDYYDADFFIYNDVVVIDPHGEITILGYPEQAFPPTDFHSATLLEDELVLVGNLGYPKQRLLGVTQILRLDLRTWRVCRETSTGEGPGRIHGHEARRGDDQRSIIVTRGFVQSADESRLIENIDDYRLDLDSSTWERLTRRNWPRFEAKRADGKRMELWEMSQALWHADHDDRREVRSRVEYPMPRDRAAFEARYRPDAVPHRVVEDEDAPHDLFRIEVHSVLVRYQEGSCDVTMTVEGDLPADVIQALTRDLEDKLWRATGIAHVVTRLITP